MHTLSHKTRAFRFVSREIIASIRSHRPLLATCFLSTAWVCLALTAHAQTATFNTASVLNVGTPQGSPLNIPANVAVDGEGNAYIADANNSRVVEVTARGTVSVLNVGTPGGMALNFPLGVAVDASGDIYIADANNGRVVEFTAGGTASVLNIGAPGGTPLNFPQGLALDSTGDLYIADSDNSRVVELAAGGAVSVVNAGSPGGLPLAFPCGVALDSAGDVYIADSNNNRIVEVTAGGTASVLNVGTPGGIALNQPFGVAVSRSGSIYIADSANNRIVEMLPGGTSVVLNAGSPDGTPLNDLNGVTADGAGDLYIPDTGNNRVVEVKPSSQALGQTALITSANPVTMSYTVSGYSGSSYTPNFRMTYGSDVQVGAATCSGGASPEICSVPVTLQPKLPGMRVDGLQVLDPGSGTVLTSTLVYGIGTGPLGVFEPGLQSTLNAGSPGGMPLNVPYGVAVDSTGNTYIADSQNNRIVEVSASGVVSVLPVGTPGGLALNTPDGVAVDGAGNIYIADYYNNRVVEVTAAGTVSVVNTGSPGGSLLANPVGIAVDSSGDLYIADFGNSRIVEVTVDGTSGVLNVGTPGGIALSGAAGVAVDDAGNVFIGDTLNNRVVKVTADGGAISVLNVGSPQGAALNQPVGLTTDGAGDVYIADFGNNRVVEVATDGTASVLPVSNPGGISMNGPTQVAVDGFGNVDIVDYGNNRVIGVNRTQQSLSFPTTSVGQSSPQQTAALRNIGNQPLVLTALATTTDFNLNGAATSCTDTTSLNGGDACSLGVEFEPITDGALTGAANITDDNLNVTGTVQQVNLSGTGVGVAATITLAETPGISVIYGTPVTVTATLTGANGVPTGNITYTLDGVLQPSASLSAGGIAQFTLPGTLVPGMHSIEVSYAGDADYQVATPSQSFTLTVTTETQTISFPAIASRVYGSTPFAVTATASSALPVTITVQSGPATISGNTVTITGAGTVVLAATQPGNIEYSAAAPVIESFQVTAAASSTSLQASRETVTAGGNVTLTATVISAFGTPMGAVTFSYGGATLGTGTLNAGVATLTTTTLPVGADAITASYAATTDYLASTSTPVTVTVTTTVTVPAGYTIAANPNTVSIQEGQTGNTTLTLTPTGGYTASVALSCQNLPANVVCVFAQNPIQLSGNNQPVNIGLALQTSVQQAQTEATSAPLSPVLPALAFWWPGSLAGCAILGRKRKRAKKQRRWMQLCLLVVVTGALAVGLSGCGGGFGPYVTPQGITTVTVTATATSGTTVTTQTVSLTMTIAE